MRPPTDATVWANCIHMLSDMLAQIGRAAQRYSVDHSGESMQIGDYAEVYTAMSSTDQEYSVTPGFTDQATYDAQIMNLCPDFDRSAHVTPEHSANFAGNAPAYQKPKPTGNGGRGGRGCGRGGGRGGGKGIRGGGAPQQNWQHVIWSQGKLNCSAVSCKLVLNMNKSNKLRAHDKENKSKAANGGHDPHSSPICSACWDCGHTVTLNQQCATPGKKLDITKFKKASGHTHGYAGQKAKHSVNAAVAADDSDDDSYGGSDGGSVSGASVVSTAASAKAAIKSATADLQKHDPTAKVTIESISEEIYKNELSKMMGELLELVQMRDVGLLNEAEFQEQKAVVLNTFVKGHMSCKDNVAKPRLRKSLNKSLRNSMGPHWPSYRDSKHWLKKSASTFGCSLRDAAISAVAKTNQQQPQQQPQNPQPENAGLRPLPGPGDVTRSLPFLLFSKESLSHLC